MDTERGHDGVRTLTISPTAPRVYGVEAQFRFGT
jgi:hypothetical protein